MRPFDSVGQFLHPQGNSLPRDARTLVELVGMERLVIERHKGIECYGAQEILVRTTYGNLRVRGEELRLCCMSREQLCIMGRVNALELMGRGGSGTVE